MKVQQLIPASGWHAVVAYRNQPLNWETLKLEGEVTYEYAVHPLIGWSVDSTGKVVPVIYSERIADVYETDGVVNPLELQHNLFIGFSATVLEPGQVLTDKLRDTLRADIESKRREYYKTPVLQNAWAEEAALIRDAQKTSGRQELVA